MLDRTTQPAIHNIGTLHLAEARALTLDNGIKMTVLDSGRQELNRLSVITDGGLLEAPSPAVARLAADTMLEGCETMTGSQIADSLDYDGAWCKASSHIHHHSMMVYSLNHRFDHVLDVITRVISAPSFPAHETAAIADKHAAQAAVNREKVTYWASLGIKRLINGPDYPLAREITPEQIISITGDDLSRWYDTAFNPRSINVFLAGRITPAMEDAVNNTIGRFTAKGQGIKPVCSKFMSADDHTPLVIDRPQSLQSAVTVGIPSIPRSHPDYIPLRLAVIALGGYFGSRLMLNIREEKGLTYGISSMLAGSASGSTIEIDTECDNRYVSQVITEINNEMNRLADPSTFTPDEIDRLKRHVESTLASTLDSPFTMMDCYENVLLSSTPADYFDQQQRHLRELTAETIATMAARYIIPAKAFTVIAGDRAKIS